MLTLIFSGRTASPTGPDAAPESMKLPRSGAVTRTWLGLICLWDPIRPEAPAAIAQVSQRYARVLDGEGGNER